MVQTAIVHALLIEDVTNAGLSNVHGKAGPVREIAVAKRD